jgi:hypothetical protein
MFFIRHKAREEKSMKRVKMLLVVMLCVVMAFGTASVPVSAEIIEVEKPAEPKRITITDIGFDKPAYHTNEDIAFHVKIDGLSNKDIDNIGYLIGRLERKTCKLYYNKEKDMFVGKMTAEKEECKSTITSISIYSKNNENINSLYNFQNYYTTILVVNNNCADGNHTIYKDNWTGSSTNFPCTESWIETINCNICNQVIYSRIVPALGHEVSDWVIKKRATFSQNGLKEKICNRCGDILQSQTIPKLPSTSKLKFKKKSITIKKGKSIKLKYTRKPTNAQDTLSWKSSKPKVVKILKNGKIKGLKKGKSVITLKTNTGKKAKITVKVK